MFDEKVDGWWSTILQFCKVSDKSFTFWEFYKGVQKYEGAMDIKFCNKPVMKELW